MIININLDKYGLKFKEKDSACKILYPKEIVPKRFRRAISTNVQVSKSLPSALNVRIMLLKNVKANIGLKIIPLSN